jgi:hypothetical protein
VKTLIKKILEKTLPPSIYLGLQAANARRYIQKFEKEEGYRDLNLKYESIVGRVVQAGPFHGLKYTELTSERHITQRLLGAYESELHPAFEACVDKPYSSVLDVGCAEGYYAVGMAMKSKSAHIHAFDTDPWARKVCRAMAKLNGVENKLSIHGFCSPEWIRANMPPRSLVISDCEGYEFVLFAPENVEQFKSCDLIIELHDKAPSEEHPIYRNLENTHEILIIPSKTHDPKQYPQIKDFSEEEQKRCVDDMRHSWQGWLFAKSREQR